MILHEWRVSLLDGTQSVRLSAQGIWLDNQIRPWSALTELAFVRYQTRSGTNEELWLSFGPDDRRRLRWIGGARQRAAWRAMLVEFATLAARKRPDLTLRDGPDAAERRAAAWIGLAVAGLALTVMVTVFSFGPSAAGALSAAWIGIVGMVVGGAIFGHYARREEPPRIGLAEFAAREGHPGTLPAN